jgi:DNA-binding NarL/FixJ family response regulator
MMPKLSVFVVDHHEVVRRGVTHLLNETDDLTVIGQASTVAQALAWVPAQRPDMAVLAVHLPDGNGVELCRGLRSRLPDLQCLMLTSDTDETVMMDAFLAGAGGFVVKDISGDDLVAAIRTVGSGRALLDRRAAAALFGRLRSAAPPPSPLAGLTDKEHTTLELIGEGLSNRQIAGRMFVTEKTVKNYVSHVLAKLGMTSRTQAAVLAATEVRDHRPGPGLTARAS